MAERDIAAAADRIAALVVDIEDLIAAFRRNRDETGDRHHVLRIAPPFEGEVRAELHATADPDRTAGPPLDLPPELFVENYRGDDPERTTVRIPTRADARRAARVDHGDGVDDSTVSEYHEREMAVWGDCVRDSVVDRVRAVPGRDGEDGVWIEVQYGYDGGT